MLGSSALPLNIGDLLQALTRPPLFERSEAAFWDDPHISSRMLQAHLDESRDAASRKPETIDRTVAWIMGYLGLMPGMHLLDLGCGPGLYCRRFAEAGLHVTGIDYSRSSVAYAIEDAARYHLPIAYRCEDYLELDCLDSYDVITLIYFDFGCLTDTERTRLLTRIHRALKAGGRFVFDARTSVDFAQQQEERTWNLELDGGFWHASPYLELQQTLIYPEADTILSQHSILTSLEEVRTYRLWERYFSTQTVSALLAYHGFSVDSIWSDLTGYLWNDTSTGMGIIAVKDRGGEGG